MATPEFEACKCFDMHDGCGACLYMSCCSCLAMKDANEKVGQDGMVPCLLSCVGLECCALMVTSQNVANAVGIPDANHCLLSLCPCFTCHHCSVYDASCKYAAGVYKKEGEMERE